LLGKNASRGGTMRITSYLLKHLDRQRFQPAVLLPGGGDLLETYRQHAPTYVYGAPAATRRERLLQRVCLSQAAPQLLRLGYHAREAARVASHQRQWVEARIRELGPHLILQTFNTPIPLFDGLDATDAPWVQQVTLSGANLNGVPHAPLARSLARAACVICEGVGVRDDLQRCWGVPRERLRVVCLGVDLSLRDEQLRVPGRPRRADLGIDADALVIGAMGAWHYSKGVDLWVEAAAQLRARYPGRPLKFLWIGGTPIERQLPYGRSLLGLMAELGLNADLICVGDQRQVYPYLDMCDIYVQPSRDDAFPHATLEAMALSKPVVAFPQGVSLEECAQGALIRVDRVSAPALADGISLLMEAPGLRESLGQAGWQLVRDHFDLAESVRRYEQVLWQTVNGR
jgi:glycosyltransferase involved in cell wall biosynthesis